MIDIEQQEAMFVAIGRILSKKIEVYAIGGTAMMLQSTKNLTLDVDLVFDKTKDREELMNALRKLGAKDSDVTLVYGLKNNTPLMLEFNNCRFDLFMSKIITSIFSNSMKERAKETHEFENMIVKVADPHDVLIMKSCTSRLKDSDDIATIIKSKKIQWDIIVEEAGNQIKLGNERAILDLGNVLENINNMGLALIPKDVLDKLWSLLTNQVKEHKKE